MGILDVGSNPTTLKDQFILLYIKYSIGLCGGIGRRSRLKIYLIKVRPLSEVIKKTCYLFNLEYKFNFVAQLVEQWTFNPNVLGSSPSKVSFKTIFSKSAYVIIYLLNLFYLSLWENSLIGKIAVFKIVDVGSNPISPVKKLIVFFFLDEWLSGLRHQIANLTYNLYTMGSNPISSSFYLKVFNL